MAVSDADFAKLRADLTAATAALATLRGQTLLLASQQNDLALQLASGIVVRRRILTATPALQQGYGVVAVNGGVQVADAAGLALVALPSGIAIAGGQPDDYVYIATAGIRPNSETGLNGGIATAVGQDINGKLVRANDPTCIPGVYYGDCNTVGDLTIRIRSTAATSDYVLQSWLQPEWDIDPVNGSARNTGMVGHPIARADTQHERVGPMHELNFDPSSTTPKVKMYIRSSLAADDCLTIRTLIRPGSVTFSGNNRMPYQIEGTLQPVTNGAGTITSVRAFDNTGVPAATGTPWGIQTTLGSLAAHRIKGRIMIQTNNVVDPLYPQAWWIAKDNDDGSGTVRVSYPTFLGASDLANGSNSGTFAVNDTFQLYDLPNIPRTFIENNNPNFTLLMRRLRFGGGYPLVTGAMNPVECSFDNFFLNGPFTNPMNCQMSGLFTMSPNARPYFTFGLFLNTLMILSGKPEFQNYVMFQGVNSLVTDGAVRVNCHTRGIQVYDSPSDGWIVWPGDEMLFAGSMTGYGNAGYGLNVKRSGRVIIGGLGAAGGEFFRATGALGDFKVGGRTSGPALNTANPYGWTGDIAYTHSNFNLSVGGGGFGQNVFDPTCPGCGIMMDT